LLYPVHGQVFIDETTDSKDNIHNKLKDDMNEHFKFIFKHSKKLKQITLLVVSHRITP